MNHTSHLQGALQQYKKIGAHTDVATASPHRLIQMLLEGALEKINLAKGYMQRGEIQLKGNHISWAISIIDGLRISLDREAGGDIAANLDALYDYMGRRLAEANLTNDVAMLDEVSRLLLEIKAAWDQVPGVLNDEADTAPGE